VLKHLISPEFLLLLRTHELLTHKIQHPKTKTSMALVRQFSKKKFQDARFLAEFRLRRPVRPGGVIVAARRLGASPTVCAGCGQGYRDGGKSDSSTPQAAQVELQRPAGGHDSVCHSRAAATCKSVTSESPAEPGPPGPVLVTYHYSVGLPASHLHGLRPTTHDSGPKPLVPSRCCRARPGPRPTFFIF
jgi:hypothetical protein